MNSSKPIKIDVDEWWFKGCFIQRQKHPKLKLYHVFKDTETQETISDCFNFKEAKILCQLNEVKNFFQGHNSFV